MSKIIYLRKFLRHNEFDNDVYTYDAHGNMLSMPHLQLMGWDFKGNLAETKRTGNGYSTYYRYDSEYYFCQSLKLY
jgi:hypothetical protein